MKKKVRVRFAPSPTGPLHIGGIRTALYNFLYAKKYNGDFILRIEDTDTKRNIKESIKYILNSLKWCNIKFNEGYNKKGEYGPYIQSKRINIYNKYLDFLIKKKLAYYSFETKKELKIYKKKYKNFLYNSLTRNYLNNSLTLNKYQLIKKKYVIRLKTPKNKNIIFYDKIYGKISINTNTIDDKIIYRSDNTPTYHFASVVDDHLMKITHIIRGKEWISSTPIHIILYNYFKWNIPVFIHLPLILNNTGGKISKRLNNTNNFPIYPINYKSKYINIKYSYEEKGFLPESIINSIALLGWCPKKNNNNILTIKKMINLFNINDINKSNVHLNYNKFIWINKLHINNTKKKLIYKKLFFYLYKKIKNLNYNINIKKIKKIIKLTKNRIYLINDIWSVTYYFFLNPKKFKIPNKISNLIKKKSKKIINLLNFIITFFKKKRNKNKINILLKKIKNFFYLKILRISIVGELIGINLLDILYLINNKIIIYRIKYFINKVIK